MNPTAVMSRVWAPAGFLAEAVAASGIDANPVQRRCGVDEDEGTRIRLPPAADPVPETADVGTCAGPASTIRRPTPSLAAGSSPRRLPARARDGTISVAALHRTEAPREWGTGNGAGLAETDAHSGYPGSRRRFQATIRVRSPRQRASQAMRRGELWLHEHLASAIFGRATSSHADDVAKPRVTRRPTILSSTHPRSQSRTSVREGGLQEQGR